MKILKKKPIQIYIDVGQDILLDALSRRRGISKAAIIRESIEKMLREIPVEEDPAMELMGIGGSGEGDLSEQHDRYLIKYTTTGKK
ncbi:MAG: ribbon-helix-helix domain-containing protein [Candidatus Brocadiaceae bacterium]|nr:ribbon-helix-helix domain-containing protein [Candidatus Brocadiaceae bacterium]